MTSIDCSTEGSRYKIAVVYICDANFHDLTLYSLASIARSHSTPLELFLMQSEYSRSVPVALQDMMASRGHKLTLLDAPVPDAASAMLGHQGRFAHISSAMFLKAAAIDALAADYDYVLYVDGDILVFDDLHCERVAGFEETAGACLDLSSATGFDDPNFFSNCERHNVSPEFFNSGVMMINARKWLETRASERFLQNLIRHQDGCPYFSACVPNDQCALNMTLGSDLKLLPVPWNVQKSALHTRVWQTAQVRHYTGRRKFLPVRPWTCDPREYSLLKVISKHCELPLPSSPYDFGVSYLLNKFRRHRTIAKYERAIADINAAQAATT